MTTIYALRAIVGAAPWLNDRTDTTTAVVVIATDEREARELAVRESGSEGNDAWLVAGSIRVEILGVSSLPPGIVLSDAS